MEVDHITKLRLLTAIARRFSIGPDSIDLPDSELSALVDGNPNRVDSCIDEFCMIGALTQEAFDDETGGFHYISAKNGLAEAIEKAVAVLIRMHATAVADKIEAESRLVELLKFDESAVKNDIKRVTDDIDKFRSLIDSEPLLAGFAAALNDLEINMTSLNRVASVYDDVYKSIIVPVRNEGRRGIRSTRNWSIASIVLSAILGLIANIYFQQRPVSVVDASKGAVPGLRRDMNAKSNLRPDVK